MKNQALFSSKDNSKELKCRLLQFLFGASRVKLPLFCFLLTFKHCSVLLERRGNFLNLEMLQHTEPLLNALV